MRTEPLRAGEVAPPFTLRSTPDQEVRLTDFRGAPLVLAFYPADFSPVCGDQMALYNELLPLFRKLGASDHRQGPDDAPVTLVEYGDYQCPYCGMAYPIVRAVQQRLGARLRFVFRNFPLSEMHRHARPAAEAAEAAGAQGRFWEMHDKLYENQTDLSERAILRYAAAAGRRRGPRRSGKAVAPRIRSR
jgi:hypothetical protein